MKLALNIPNIISLSRIPALFVIVALLSISVKGTATGAFVLFVIGALTDWLDGYVARRYDIVSNFGKVIDALTDKIYVIGLFVTLLAFGFLPEWALFFILLIIGREFIVTGLRLVVASKGLVLAAEKMGKVKTLFQILTIGIFLFGNAMFMDFSEYVEPWMRFAITSIGFGFFFIASYLTVSSGVSYIIKYWDVFMEKEGG